MMLPWLGLNSYEVYLDMARRKAPKATPGGRSPQDESTVHVLEDRPWSEAEAKREIDKRKTSGMPLELPTDRVGVQTYDDGASKAPDGGGAVLLPAEHGAQPHGDTTSR